MVGTKDKSTGVLIVLNFLLLFLILWSNLKKITFHCFHVMDLGIFQEAIYRLGAGEGLNPFIHVRGINIFNDHFHPIIFLGAPFSWIFNWHPFSLIIFEWLWLVLLLGCVILFSQKENISIHRVGIMCLLVLLTKGILKGLEYPIHPATWSIVPIFLIFYFIRRDEFKPILLTSVFLCLFKESYPFAILGLSFYFLFKKSIKEFATLFLVSALFLIFIFKVKPMIIGESFGHGFDIISNLKMRPFAYLMDTVNQFEFVSFFKLLYPFFIPFFILSRSWKREKSISVYVAILSFGTPLFLMHFFANKINFHYGAQFVAILLPFVLFDFVPLVFQRRKVLIISTLIFYLSSASVYTKIFKSVFLDKVSQCRIDDGKIKSTEELSKVMNNIPKEEFVLSTGGVLPWFIHPDRRYLQLSIFSKPQDFYRYLLIEKEKNGVYPLTRKAIDSILIKCKPYVDEVLFNDDYFIFQKGKFTEECLKQKEMLSY